MPKIDWVNWYLTKLAAGEIHDQRLDDDPDGSAANALAKVVIRKRNDDTPLLFNDIQLRDEPRSNTDITRTNTEDDDKKLSEKLREAVAAMIAAAPGLHPQHAMRWLLHTEQGQAFLAQHTTKGNTAMPQIDLAKLIPITEDALNAQVTKRDNETFAKAFTRKYESDIEYRRQWAALTDAKHLHGYLKSLASLKPTSTETGSTQTSDDSAEAIRLLNEMATKQGRKFEEVFADPANKALAGKTYTAAHRPTASSTSGSELQR
jgi:hypothetical protein